MTLIISRLPRPSRLVLYFIERRVIMMNRPLRRPMWLVGWVARRHPEATVDGPPGFTRGSRRRRFR